MNITFFNRKRNPNERSIERLFRFIKEAITVQGLSLREVENPYNNGLWNVLKAIFFFRRQVAKDDIVHITGDIHFSVIGLKSRKTVLTVHDLGLYRKLPFLRFLVFKLFWVYLPFKRAQIIAAISENTKEEICCLMPSVAHKVVVVPNCITMAINPIDALKNNTTTQVLIVGTRENKNIERAIEALEGLDIVLDIVGRLSATQEALLKEHRIPYKNYINIEEEALLALYKKADILLFVSYYEGFGLPILEAQAQNVLVVTSSIAPMDKLCGGGGLLVDPYSVVAIRQAIQTLLEASDTEKLALIAKGKQNLIKYTATAVAEQYITLYKQLK